MSAVREIITQQELDKRIDAIKLCGANRGPHDYIPISWITASNVEKVDLLMCKVCFCRISMQTLYAHFGELKV